MADTPKPMQGTWTLTAPDGRTWQADAPIRCVAAESRERIPAEVALKRIFDAASEDHDWQPIETAPKDGTRVILSWGGKSINGFYLDNTHTATPWAGWRVESMVVQPAGKPTHWQPLPPPYGVTLVDGQAKPPSGTDAAPLLPPLKMLSYELQGVLADVRETGKFDDVCQETVRRVMVALAAADRRQRAAVQPEQPQDQFCDANCTWRDHHPECVRAAPTVLPLLPEDREALSPPSMDGAVQAATSGGER